MCVTIFLNSMTFFLFCIMAFPGHVWQLSLLYHVKYFCYNMAIFLYQHATTEHVGKFHFYDMTILYAIAGQSISYGKILRCRMVNPKHGGNSHLYIMAIFCAAAWQTKNTWQVSLLHHGNYLLATWCNMTILHSQHGKFSINVWERGRRASIIR